MLILLTKTKAYWYIGIIILLVLAECGLVGFIGVWREWYWQAIVQKDITHFFKLVGEFAAAALGACFINGRTSYVINYFSLQIRTNLTKNALETNERFKVEGFEQRIQDDCFRYPLLGITLLSNILKNIFVLVTFAIIIIMQVGVWYLLLPLGYVILGTLIAYLLAHPLIRLNYLNQVLEARFRMVLRTFKDSEFNAMPSTYVQVFANNHSLFKTTKKLNYFQSFYNQITVIVPHLLLFSVYFTGKITFGVFMQIAASMAHIIDAMSYLINAFTDINNFLACRKRLRELKVI